MKVASIKAFYEHWEQAKKSGHDLYICARYIRDDRSPLVALESVAVFVQGRVDLWAEYIPDRPIVIPDWLRQEWK